MRLIERAALGSLLFVQPLACSYSVILLGGSTPKRCLKAEMPEERLRISAETWALWAVRLAELATVRIRVDMTATMELAISRSTSVKASRRASSWERPGDRDHWRAAGVRELCMNAAP